MFSTNLRPKLRSTLMFVTVTQAFYFHCGELKEFKKKAILMIFCVVLSHWPATALQGRQVFI